MATANFRINQTGHATLEIGTVGKSRDDLEIGMPCVLRNEDDTGVTSSRWTLTAPKGSSAVLTGPFSLSASFTPDVAGTYIVDLKINEGKAGQVQRLLAAVRLPSVTVGTFSGRLRYPGAGEDEEANWDYDFGAGPVENTTGWQGDLDDWLRVVHNISIGAGGGGGMGILSAVDTSQPGFTGLVDQWKFEDDLLAENGTGRDLRTENALNRFCSLRSKRFFSMAKFQHLYRNGNNDPELSISGALTVYALVELNSLSSTGSTIISFATPGSNAPGTNYQWGLLFDGSTYEIRYLHETGAGTAHYVNFVTPPSGPILYTLRRSADLGGGAQNVSLYMDGVLVSAGSTVGVATDGTGTQQLHIGGQDLTMLVGDVVICDEEHSPATILAVAQQVGVV